MNGKGQNTRTDDVNKTIVWIPAGDRSTPSSRLRVYDVAEALEQQYGVKNIFPPFQLASCPRAVFVQKVCDRSLFPMLKQLKEKNCRCLYDLCDPIWLQTEVNRRRNWSVDEMVAIADEIITPTTAMAKAVTSRYKNCKCRVIADSIAMHAPEFRAPKKHIKKERLMIGWIGTALNMVHLPMIAEPLKRLNALHPIVLRLITASHNGMIPALPEIPVEFIPWSLHDHLRYLSECDIIVIPMSITEGTATKSQNRLQLAWALGIPAVFSPIESYLELVVGQAHLGKIAETPEEWAVHLLNLVSPEERNAIGREAHALILKEHSLAVRLPLWADAVLGPTA